MDCRNSSLLLPEERKQLGESQSKHEEKDICIFNGSKMFSQVFSYLYLLLLLQIVATQLKIKRKAHKI